MARFGPRPRNAAARFWEFVEVTPGCWEWRGARQRNGYGSFRMNSPRRQVRAHRASYEFVFGDIPEGRVVMHTCDNRGCVRPAHLRLGTTLDNNRDAKAKGRGPVGVLHGSRTHPDAFPHCPTCGQFGHSLHGRDERDEDGGVE